VLKTDTMSSSEPKLSLSKVIIFCLHVYLTFPVQNPEDYQKINKILYSLLDYRSFCLGGENFEELVDVNQPISRTTEAQPILSFRKSTILVPTVIYDLLTMSGVFTRIVEIYLMP